MTTTWTVLVHNGAFALVGELDDVIGLELVARFNDVGTWALDVAANSPAHYLLTRTLGAGVVLLRNDVVVLSGPVTKPARKRTGARDVVTIGGVDDSVWLARRLAHPQPGSSAPPYSSSAYDTRTGTCSTVLRNYVNVNAGPGAISARRVPGLVLGTNPLVGSSVTGEARWQPLLELLQELAVAGGGLGFDVRQVGTTLEFEVYQPRDVTSSIVFDDELGDLGDFSYSKTAPKANYVYCGGGGEGTARTIREGQDPTSIAAWGRIEMFRDRRDTSVSSELDQSIDEELATNGERVEISADLLDVPQRAFLDDYGLGDRVRVNLPDGTVVTEVIREATIKVTNGDEVTSPTGDLSSESITSRVGTAGARSGTPTWKATTALDRRVTNLERT